MYIPLLTLAGCQSDQKFVEAVTDTGDTDSLPIFTNPSLSAGLVMDTCLAVPQCPVNFEEEGPDSDCDQDVQDKETAIIDRMLKSAENDISLNDIIDGKVSVTARVGYTYLDDDNNPVAGYESGYEVATIIFALGNQVDTFEAVINWSEPLPFESLQCSAVTAIGNWTIDSPFSETDESFFAYMDHAFFEADEAKPAQENGRNLYNNMGGYTSTASDYTIADSLDINLGFIFENPETHYIEGSLEQMDEAISDMAQMTKTLLGVQSEDFEEIEQPEVGELIPLESSAIVFWEAQ